MLPLAATLTGAGSADTARVPIRPMVGRHEARGAKIDTSWKGSEGANVA
jgi:hypothetical protein